MTQQKEIISTLNDLIETLKDGQQGFREASEAVKDSQLKMLFNEYSLQRSKFAGELQAEAINLGENTPETEGSAVGSMHRARSRVYLRAPIQAPEGLPRSRVRRRRHGPGHEPRTLRANSTASGRVASAQG